MISAELGCHIPAGKSLVKATQRKKKGHGVMPCPFDSLPVFKPALCVCRYVRAGGNIRPNVDVGRTAEVPDKRRAFQTPAIPLLVLADVPFAIERQGTLIQATLGLQALQGFVAIAL